MMKTFSFFTLLSCLLFVSACGTDDSTDDPVEETGALSISVLYVDGSTAMDAAVTLYLTQNDYLNETNPDKTGSTDQTGEVVFTDLPLVKYWYTVKKDGATNAASNFQTGVALTAGETLEKTTQLRQ